MKYKNIKIICLLSLMILCLGLSAYGKNTKKTKQKKDSIKFYNNIKISSKNKSAIKKLYKKAKITKKKWCAHRGYSSLAPENTVAAYILAASCGASGIEADVRITKDGKLFMMHDANVKRMTNGSGKIEHMSSKKVKKLKITGGKNAKKFKNLRVCTFEDYLRVCKNYGCVAVVEIKTVRNKKLRKKLIKKVSETLQQFDMQKNCYIISFSPDTLIRMRKINKIVPVKLMKKETYCKADAAEIKKYYQKYKKIKKLKPPIKLRGTKCYDFPI